jgi:hypothetical protein
LGLTAGAFWRLTFPEYQALQSVYDGHLKRWAIEMSMFANVHFRDPANPLAEAWEPDHFLGKPRGQISSGATMHAGVEHLLALWKGDKAEDIPEWAKAAKWRHERANERVN